MKKKTYLVTGGNGFIGSAIVARLVAGGNKVRVLDNNLRGTSARLGEVASMVEMVSVDIRDATAVRNCCKGVDSVIHLAYLQGTQFFYSKPEMVLDIGVKGIVNVIEGCIAEKVKEIMLASSSEVYHMPSMIPTDESVPLVIPDLLNPRYSYSSGKIISEMMVINYGRKYFERVCIFRPHNVYGPDMGWEHVVPQLTLKIKEIAVSTDKKTIQVPIQGTGQETRAFIFIQDFVDGFLAVLEKGVHLGVYHIGTTEEKKISDLVREIVKYFKRTVEVVPGELLRGSPLRRCPDITKLRGLGFEPKISFSEGIQMTARWYDQHSEERPKISKTGEELYER